MEKVAVISKTTILHPILFSVCPALFIFLRSLNLIPVKELIFTSLFSAAITAAIWIFFFLILKDRKKSALIVSFGLGLFFSYGYIYNYFSDFTFGDHYLKHSYLLALYLGLSIILLAYFIRTKKSFVKSTKIVNYCSIFLITILLVAIGFNYLDRMNRTERALENAPEEIQTNPPDIYYIILDSYAHPYILNETYGYDDEQLIAFLKENNFYIASESHSNYRHTFLSLASSLNMEYVDPLIDGSSKESSNFHRIYKLTDNNKIMKIMKSYGYDVINFASRDGVTGNIRVADVNLCEKNPYMHSQLFISMIKSTILEPAYTEFFRTFSNERDLCVFSELSDLNKKETKPFFAFAHILLPHSPYRFGPNGEDLETDDQKIGYINQVQFVNKKIMSTITSILNNSSTPPIIIIQSDTGTSLPSDDLSEIMKRKLKIFNAYHLPNNGSATLYNTITPVNSFRLILDRYFGQDYPLLDDKTLYSDYNNRFNFTDVTHLLKKYDMGIRN